MFSSVDKMIMAGLSSVAGYFVGKGAITPEDATQLVNAVAAIATWGVGMFLTWLVPNKK